MSVSAKTSLSNSHTGNSSLPLIHPLSPRTKALHLEGLGLTHELHVLLARVCFCILGPRQMPRMTSWSGDVCQSDFNLTPNGPRKAPRRGYPGPEGHGGQPANPKP